LFVITPPNKLFTVFFFKTNKSQQLKCRKICPKSKKLFSMLALTSSGDISSILVIRSVKNSVISFCSPVLRGCLSIVYVLQKGLGLYALHSLSYKEKDGK
jgi:hypothetical protein